MLQAMARSMKHKKPRKGPLTLRVKQLMRRNKAWNNWVGRSLIKLAHHYEPKQRCLT